MADTGGDHTSEAGKRLNFAEKLPRAHKRCCNEKCRALLTLTAKVSASVRGCQRDCQGCPTAVHCATTGF
jgi:hypothetical protein